MRPSSIMIAIVASGSIAHGQSIVAQSTIIARDPATGGRVQVASTLWDLPGPFIRYEYKATNIDYQPEPSVGNGFSGLHLSWGILPGPWPVGGLTAPPAWNTSAQLMMGGVAHVDYEAPGPLTGLMPGFMGVFAFEVEGFLKGYSDKVDVVFGVPYGNTHIAGAEAYPFELVDELDPGRTILHPIPGPAASAILAAGIIMSRRRRPSKG